MTPLSTSHDPQVFYDGIALILRTISGMKISFWKLGSLEQRGKDLSQRRLFSVKVN